MCQCSFNHGDLSLDEYIAKAGQHKDAEVYAKLKKELLGRLGICVSALSDMSLTDLIKLSPSGFRKDSDRAFETAMCIESVQGLIAVAELFDLYCAQAVSNEILKEFRQIKLAGGLK